MRILYISRGNNPHDRRFLTALAATEHELTFAALESSPADEREYLPSEIALVGLSQKSEAKVSNQLHEIIEALRPDLIHAGPIQSGAHLVASLRFRPLLSMSWGSDLLLDAQEGSGRDRARYVLKRTDVLACDCDAVRRAAIELGMPSEQIVVFPWGVDLERFTPTRNGHLRERLGWKDEFVVISTRAHEPIYGVDTVVDGFISAARKVPGLRLLLLQDGSMRESLMSVLESAGVSDRVHAPGTIAERDLPDYYGAADLYLSASHSDGTSISLLEAMASGVPPLVSDIPGNREWVESGETGWLFSVGDSSMLASKVAAVIQDRDRRVATGNRVRRVAEDRADWNKNFQALLSAYEFTVNLERSQA